MSAMTPPRPTPTPSPGEPLESQIERLANFIMAEVPGEPSQSEGAVDTAIRVMRSLVTAHAGLVERAEKAERELAEADALLGQWQGPQPPIVEKIRTLQNSHKAWFDSAEKSSAEAKRAWREHRAADSRVAALVAALEAMGLRAQH